ncbi:MAG TPA: hypothetical protein VGU01_13280 [Sphingomicrobium sp.]|nr:hypothetical protein [Sphingomicrobium sp.]
MNTDPAHPQRLQRESSRIGYGLSIALSAILGALCILLLTGRHQGSRSDPGTAVWPAMMVPVSQTGVVDDRGRFRQIFCALDAEHGAQFSIQRPCNAALQRLSGEALPTTRPLPQPPPDRAKRFHIIIIPGMFGECVRSSAMPLEDAAAYMRAQGYRVDTIDVEGRSSSVRNAGIIARILPKMLKPGERLLIIGYSKGMSDILETLALHGQAIPAGSAIVSLAGIISGTPLADHPADLDRMVSRIPMTNCGPGDGGAVKSVSRQHRIAWLAAHPLPVDRTYFSVAAFTDEANISSPLKRTYSNLSKVDPRNDGQVLYTDAIVPGSHLLGYVNADHWAVALPFARKAPGLRRLFAGHNDYPREILLEAIVRSVEDQLGPPDPARH